MLKPVRGSRGQGLREEFGTGGCYTRPREVVAFKISFKATFSRKLNSCDDVWNIQPLNSIQRVYWKWTINNFFVLFPLAMIQWCFAFNLNSISLDFFGGASPLECSEKDQNCKLQFPQPDYWPRHSPDFRTVFGIMIRPFSICEIGKTWGTNKQINKQTNKNWNF